MDNEIIFGEYKVKLYTYNNEFHKDKMYADIESPPSSGNIEHDNRMVDKAIDSLLLLKARWTFTQYTPLYLQRQFGGWYDLIEEYFDKIQEIVNGTGAKLNIYYIKEKYGHIDMSWSGHNDELMELILELEDRSMKVCDKCGKRGKLRDDLGRWRTLCKTHYEEIKKK